MQIVQTLHQYADKHTTARHADEAVASCPSLTCEKKQHVENTGARSNKLCLTGTVPITYSGATYNIPLYIWFPADYPSRGPTAYVMPTPGMAIQPGHRHVGADGMCYFPYLNSWNRATHNAVGLVHAAKEIFSGSPPVYAQPAGQPPPRPQPPPTYGQQQQQQRPQQPQVNQREQASKRITTLLKAHLQKKNGELSTKFQEMSETQMRLDSGKAHITKGVHDLQTEKRECEQYFSALLGTNAELEKWLAENDKGDAEIDPDAVVAPADPLSEQLLTNLVADQAIEDTIFKLGQLYHQRAIDKDGKEATEIYMREVRSLAEKQFMARAYVNAVCKRKREMHGRR